MPKNISTAICLSRIGLGLIFCYCLMASLFAAYFAQIHVTLRFFPFPIFIGEILLFICLLLFLSVSKDAKLFDRRSIVLLSLYFGWVLVKALINFHFDGPLTARNAALFYYPIFAVFAYCFYQKAKITRKVLMSLALLAAGILFFKVTRLYYGWTYITLFAIAVWNTKSVKWRWLGLLFLAVFFLLGREYLYAGSRSNFVSVFGAVIFLVSYFGALLAKRRDYVRLNILLISLLFFTLGYFIFSPRNDIASVTSLKGIINTYQTFDRVYQARQGAFVPQKLSAHLYNYKNFRDLFITSPSVTSQPVVTAGAQKAREQTLEAEKARPKPAVIQAAQAERARELAAEIKRAGEIAAELEKARAAEIKRARQQALEAERLREQAAGAQKARELTAELEKARAAELERAREQAAEAQKAREQTLEAEKARPKPAVIQAAQAERARQQALEAERLREQAAGAQKARELTAELEKARAAELERAREQAAEAQKAREQTLEAEKARELAAEIKRTSDQLRNVISSHILPNQIQEERSLDLNKINIVFRLFIWRDMAREFIQEPKAWFWGFSFGHPQRSRSLEVMHWAEGEWSRDGWITSHNSFFHIIYRAGILGVCLIGILFFMIGRLVRDFFNLNSIIGGLLVGSLVYWLVLSNFLIILEFPYNAIVFWSLFGITMAYRDGLKAKTFKS